MKTDPMGAELFHAEGQTDRHVEANGRISRRRITTKYPSKGYLCLI